MGRPTGARNGTGRIYELTEQEKIDLRMMLKKPKQMVGNIHIVVPVHYGTRGVIWERRFVTEKALEGWRQEYPNLEVIE